MLASARMLKLVNSTIRLRRSSGAWSLTADAGLRTLRLYISGIMSTFVEKLEVSLSLTKSITSQFLIDNFQQVSSWAARPRSSASFVSCALSASCISNRPSPRLESALSHRKQKVALVSNRPQFAFCNFQYSSLRNPDDPRHSDNNCESRAAGAGHGVPAMGHVPSLPSSMPGSLPPLSPLLPLSPLPPHFRSHPHFLIDNDMRSREMSCHCKQSTYEFLIDNEFQFISRKFKVEQPGKAV